MGQANQSSQCGWEGALGVGVSQRPQAGETLGWRLSGDSLPTGSPEDASTQAGPASPQPSPHPRIQNLAWWGLLRPAFLWAGEPHPEWAPEPLLHHRSGHKMEPFKTQSLPPAPSTAQPLAGEPRWASGSHLHRAPQASWCLWGSSEHAGWVVVAQRGPGARVSRGSWDCLWPVRVLSGWSVRLGMQLLALWAGV